MREIALQVATQRSLVPHDDATHTLPVRQFRMGPSVDDWIEFLVGTGIAAESNTAE
jgi:hypothetical protein